MTPYFTGYPFQGIKRQFSSPPRISSRYCYPSLLYNTRLYNVHRPGTHEPAGRRVHQRAPAAQSHQVEDRGNGRGRRPPLRHIPAAQGFARLRVENPQPVPGDRQHQTGRDRRQQAQSGHAGRGETHRGVQESQPGHVQLGDPRQTGKGALYKIYVPVFFFFFSYPPKHIVIIVVLLCSVYRFAHVRGGGGDGFFF